MRILLVEPDIGQANWAARKLQNAFPGAVMEIIHKGWKFYEWLEKLCDRQVPDVVILDVIASWCNPEDIGKVEIPKNITGYSGLTYHRSLLDNELTRKVPVIYHTAYPEAAMAFSLPAGTPVVEKDSPDYDLAEEIQKAVRH